MQLLLQCGQRSNIYSYYQAPLLHNVTSPHYPPLYTRNVERLMGDTSTGPGQMSVNSLWPIMLMSTTSMGMCIGCLVSFGWIVGRGYSLLGQEHILVHIKHALTKQQKVHNGREIQIP